MAQIVKKNKTLLFAAIVALVVAYAIFDLKKQESDEKSKAEKSVILQMKEDQVKSLVIKNAQETVHLEKTVDGWKFEGSLQEFADQKAVEDFITGLATEKSSSVASESTNLDLKPFGLDQPQGTIVVKNNLDQATTLAVGTRKNFEGQTYVRKNDENKVYVASATWASKVEKKAFDFRDRRLMRMSNQSVIGIKLSKGKEQINLVKKDDQWQLQGFPEKKLDQNKVREIISMLNVSQAGEFLKVVKPKKAVVKVSLEISHRNDKKWMGQFYTDNTLLTSEPEFLLKVDPVTVDKFFNVTLDSLRDHKEPFIFNKADIHRIDVNGKAIDSELLQNAAQKISSFEIGEFKDVKSHPSLEKPKRVISLRKEDGSELFNISIGDRAQEKNFYGYWAKASNYPNAFLLRGADVDELKLEKTEGK